MFNNNSSIRLVPVGVRHLTFFMDKTDGTFTSGTGRSVNASSHFTTHQRATESSPVKVWRRSPDKHQKTVPLCITHLRNHAPSIQHHHPESYPTCSYTILRTAPATALTWTSAPGGGGGRGIGDWGTGRAVTGGLGWSSGWGCWRTWPWWARRRLSASVRSGPWWPPRPLSSCQSGWSPRLGSHLRGQQIKNKHGPLLLYRVETQHRKVGDFVLFCFLTYRKKEEKQHTHTPVIDCMWGCIVSLVPSPVKGTQSILPPCQLQSQPATHTLPPSIVLGDIWAVSLEIFLFWLPPERSIKRLCSTGGTYWRERMLCVRYRLYVR